MLFAGCVAPGSLVGGKPKLRFGVLSDLHVTDWASAEVFRKALAYFRDREVDAVMITGDLTDHGLMSQLENVSKSWYSVFPFDKGLGGKTVEKLFVTGNHDVEGLKYDSPEMVKSLEAMKLTAEQAGRQSLSRLGLANCWPKCFYEPYMPVFSKTVCGIDFVGAHWDAWEGVRGLEEKWRANVSRINTDRPFFFFQHAHPRATVYGEDCWGQDKGQSTLCLKDYPNAVAVTGHSHLTLTDGRSYWRGEFTSIGASSLSYVTAPEGKKRRNQPHYRTEGECRQGQLIEVYGDRLVIERRDFVHDEPLGDDIVFELPTRGSTFAVRAFSKNNLPAFAKNTKITADLEGDAIKVVFLGAFANPTAYPFDYKVSVEYVRAGGAKGSAESRWFQAEVCFSRARAEKAENVVTIPLKELPEDVLQARVRVTAFNCYGGEGGWIVSDSVHFKTGV